MKRLLALIALVFASLGAHAADSYICDCDSGSGRTAYSACAAGATGNTGTTAGSPKQTRADMSTLTGAVTGGNSIRVCMGGVLRWASSISNIQGQASCTVAAPCTIDSYLPSWMPDPTGQGGSGGTVTYGALTVTDSSKSWTVNAWAGYEVEVLNRRGGPMRARIASNTATALTLDPLLPHLTTAWALTPAAATAFTIEGARPALLLTQAGMTASSYVMSFAGNATFGTTSTKKFAVKNVVVGGMVPGTTVTSASKTGSTVTVIATAHNVTTGQQISVYNTSNTATSTTQTATKVDADTFTYPCSGCGSDGAITGLAYYIMPSWALLGSPTGDNFEADRVTILGTGTGMQFGGAINNDHNPSNLTVTRSMVIGVGAIGILTSASNTILTQNTFDHNAASFFDHDIYLTGHSLVYPAKTISSIVGDGVTTTITTSTAHGIPTDAGVLTTGRGTGVAVASVTGGTGNFNVGSIGAPWSSTVPVTVTGPTTFTYASTGNGTGTPGTYTIAVGGTMRQAVIRHNTMVHGNLGDAGRCGTSHAIQHGNWQYVSWDDNDILEPTVPTASCVGFAHTNGVYTNAESFENLSNTMMRGNLFVNMWGALIVGEGTDMTVENNSIYTEGGDSNGVGCLMAPKDYLAYQTQWPLVHRLKVRQNTCYIKNPTARAYGFALSKNNATALTGVIVTGNIVYFGTGGTTEATANTSCFSLDAKSSVSDHTDANYRLPNTSFADFTKNLCHFASGTGAYAWAGGSTKTLATFETWLGAGSTSSSSSDPLFANTPSSSNMWDLTIQTGSPAKNTGPTTGSSAKRDAKSCLRDATPDMGAFEYFASACTPVTSAPVGVGVQ